MDEIELFEDTIEDGFEGMPDLYDTIRVRCDDEANSGILVQISYCTYMLDDGSGDEQFSYYRMTLLNESRLGRLSGNWEKYHPCVELPDRLFAQDETLDFAHSRIVLAEKDIIGKYMVGLNRSNGW